MGWIQYLGLDRSLVGSEPEMQKMQKMQKIVAE